MIIGLPGRDPVTESWLQQVFTALGLAPDAWRVQHYHFWDRQGALPGPPDWAGLEEEASRAAGSGANRVAAKSLGTRIALAAFELHGWRPERAVFIGTPLQAYDDRAIELLREFAGRVPTLFVQQQEDFLGSFATLAETLAGTRLATLAEVPGSDHMYADLNALTAAITAWEH